MKNGLDFSASNSIDLTTVSLGPSNVALNDMKGEKKRRIQVLQLISGSAKIIEHFYSLLQELCSLRYKQTLPLLSALTEKHTC